ncbi:MAG: hypothetical protein K0S47_2624 [Herbinix sp.]|jgi:endonuclease/exonuclease/phosphatase family metal-dependent hydrolase|nr:hypothetical protein [Herbinix sp.]
MKLVTFNIRCDYGQDGKNIFNNRKSFVLDKIREESPDIICFQEVLPHVALWLKENLSDYYVLGCGRDEQLKDEQTTIAYKKLKFNVMGLEVFWLSETPQVPASRYPDQSTCPRVCTMALLQNMENGDCFRIYNTHLDHEGVEARRLGILQILDKMKQDKSFVPAPAILTGDLNAYPDSMELTQIMNDPAFIDATSEITVSYHDYGKEEHSSKIDYIFIPAEFEYKEVRVWDDCIDGLFLSDHYPISVEIYTK